MIPKWLLAVILPIFFTVLLGVLGGVLDVRLSIARIEESNRERDHRLERIERLLDRTASSTEY